jgi:uncharacterized protein YndB with AHSA1/START domain
MDSNNDLVAEASVAVNAPVAQVWEALVDPDTIPRYMFGAEVESDWKVGSAIVWKGEWQGKPFTDRGVIRRFEPNRVLEYSHFSPLSGKADVPENHHTVHIELADRGADTVVTLSQDNNPTEQAREHSEKNWQAMLDALKMVVES